MKTWRCRCPAIRALKLAQHWLRQPDDTQAIAALAARLALAHRAAAVPAQTGLTVEAWRQKARLLHAVASLAVAPRHRCRAGLWLS
jgi:glycerol kinase